MPNSSKLRSKLKAADRRRRRRQSGSVNPATNNTSHSTAKPTATQTIDVASILVEAALAEADSSPELKDTAIVNALRSIKNDSPPNSQYTERVFRRMVADLDAAGVSQSDRLRSAADLLSVAVENTAPDEPDRLIKYLTLIAS